jgi:hypothetical protein
MNNDFFKEEKTLPLVIIIAEILWLVTVIAKILWMGVINGNW